ncbi:MAG TPA: hypothetical protein VMO20_01420 [Candidatus Acidoferrum sp.]|nr:hypothetical protein [Candidatus Acidoferrum sp.]
MNNHHSLSETQPDSQPKSLPRASVGKIARFPADIRRQINLRLFNGQCGPEILAWLNDLPAVREILTAGFAGAPVTKQNLSNWRATGYRRWQLEQNRLTVMKDRGQYAADIAEAAGGNISRGAAAAASERILELLDDDSGEKTDPEALLKVGTVAARLLRAEQNAVCLKIAQERLRQQEIQLLLMRDRTQRDDVAIALRVLGDAVAEQIAAAPINNAEKIELLGRHMFGKLWEPRPIPSPSSSPSVGRDSVEP